MLQSYDDESAVLAKTTEKYNPGVPPINWLPLVPQLLQCIVRPEGNHLLSIISHISKLYPQAVYFSMCTLYMTLKMELREMRNKHNYILNAAKSKYRFD